jgi:hypothetical protein
VAPERLAPIKVEIERMANAAAGTSDRPAAAAPLPAPNQPAPANAQTAEQKSSGNPTLKRNPTPGVR